MTGKATKQQTSRTILTVQASEGSSDNLRGTVEDKDKNKKKEEEKRNV